MLKTRYGLDSKMHLVLSNEIKSLICDQNEEEIYWKNLESIIFSIRKKYYDNNIIYLFRFKREYYSKSFFR